MKLCVICKGRKKLCGRENCPILIKHSVENLARNLHGKKDYFGYSNFPFVGEFNYPKVSAGPIVANERDMALFSSKYWYGQTIDKIISFRVNMLRSKQPMYVKELENKNLQALQELALSLLPVDTEIYFKKPLKFFGDEWFDDIVAPVGPSVEIENLRICENPKIPKEFDEVIEEKMLATDAMNLLAKSFDVDEISRLLSVGLLGKERKMVPTRWAITATDDTLSKQRIARIKEFETIDFITIFSSSFLGNHFEIIFAPGNWSFEMVEIYTPGCLWVTKGQGSVIINDWEGYKGRTNYASNISGAYYAARLACTEKLEEMKKQATVIVIREITPDYSAPLGVWVIREACRKMGNKTVCESLRDAVLAVSARLKTGNAWKEKSALLKHLLSRELFLKYL